MDNTEIAESVLIEFAREKSIDISDCDGFYEIADVVEESIDSRDDLSYSTELEIVITAEFTTGLDVDSMLWEDWFDSAKTQLTVDIADDGFNRQASVQNVELENVLDW